MHLKRPIKEICKDLWYDFWIEVLELLAPDDSCLWCNGPIPAVELLQGAAVCPQCRRELAQYKRCPVCAAFLPENISAEQRALHQSLCRPPEALGITAVAAFAPYYGQLRQNILRLKYHGRRLLAKPLGRELAGAWRQTGWTADVIIPVPVHEAKRRERGYNQCDLLAKTCGELLELPVGYNVLVRTRATDVQNKLNAAERQANVANAFACTSDAAQLAGKRIILLDDIITTGATMRACALALRQYAPAAVYGLAVASKLYIEQEKNEQEK